MGINPNRLPYIAKTAVVLFEHTNNTIDSNINKAKEMHYVADLLKDLVETAYPIEESKDKYNPSNDPFDALLYALDLKPINKAILEDIEKDFQNIAKMMKNYKPPMAGEF